VSPFADQSASAGSLSAVQQQAVQSLLRIAPVVDELGSRFAAAGHEIALVGGPVRDILLGRGSKDLDFATSAHPDVVERLLSGWADHVWDIGKAFGTIGSRKGEWVLEITTYRSESYDRTSRKPEVAYGDVARTVNVVDAVPLLVMERLATATLFWVMNFVWSIRIDPDVCTLRK